MIKTKLFLLPYAGGSARGYMTMKRYFDAEAFEIIPLELAGRGGRRKEPCFTDINSCVEDLYQVMLPQIEQCKYAIFGHSLGTIVGFELIRYIEKQHKNLPCCGIFSGRVAPGATFPGPSIGHLEDEEFLANFSALEALPNEMLKNDEIKKLVLPVLRADVKMSESYQYEMQEKLHCDLYILYGEDDLLLNEKGVREWENEVTGAIHFIGFPGGHFYYKDNVKLFTNKINEIMAQYK